ncbi:hypothetical protein SY88_13135 [Clostridiales bacterium PH28_bin88]|nr:hypothetical protein SY88_13135 [Clostridiales bacterium PH28_bin88]
MTGQEDKASSKQVHPRNTLNELTGEEWLYFTKPLLVTTYPSAYGHRLRKQHGANKPPQLMKQLIEFFTKRDGLVLDPFAGVGGTLIGASIADPPRRAMGMEINPRWVEIYHQVCREEGIEPQEMLTGDCLALMRQLEDASVAFITTDPPYNIHLEQTMANGRYPEFANRHTDYNMRSEDAGDLANLPCYEAYLQAMEEVFAQCLRVLMPKKYMTVILRDTYQGGEYVMTHADLADRARRQGFILKGDIIWYQSGTRLRPYGYPYAYVPNISYQHILVLQKPALSTR